MALAREDGDPEARDLLGRVLSESQEFTGLWDRHEVRLHLGEEPKAMIHPEIGLIELDCQVLVAENQAQALLVYTATPGSEAYEKLMLLAVIGAQKLEG